MSQPFARSVLYVHSGAALYGSSVSLLELASRLPRERYRPLVALPQEGPLADELRARGVETVMFPLGVLKRTFRPDQFAALLWQHACASRRLAALIRARDIEIVHTTTSHVFSGAIAARRTGRPHIAHVRENILPPKMVSRAVARLLWAWSDRIIVVSRGAAKDFLGARRDAPKVKVIYNGVDVSAFQAEMEPAEARERLGRPREELSVGVIGRLAPWKGHSVFLEAAASIAKTYPAARFVILGDSDTRRNEAHKARLLALSESLGLAERVRWEGFVSPLQPQLAALEVVVVPSVRPEPFGRVLIEAMAMGRPVVATNHGGPPEILAHGGGLLVPPGNAEALAAAVGKLLSDEKLRRETGRIGREQARARFSIEEHVAAVVKVYDDL